MPSYVTHRLFGEQVIKTLGEFPGTSNVKDHCVAFLWGVQGPDLLFYLFNEKASHLNDLGGIMHRSRTDKLFNEISRLLISNKNSPSYPALASYAYGFICHYCLDRNIHEYVYCACESFKKEYITDSPFGVHIKLETDMDTAFYREFHGGNIRRFKLEPELLSRTDDIEAIGYFHSEILRSVFGCEVDCALIRDCVPKFYRREEKNFDPAGIKSWCRLRFKELQDGEHNTHTVNWRPARVRRDVLNKEHRPWNNMWYPDTVYNYSLIDIFNRSVTDAAEMIREMERHTLSGEPFVRKNMVSFDNGNPKYYPNFENE